MKFRTLLLSCVAIVLVTATAFGQAKSDFGNCPSRDANGDWLCTATNSGDVVGPGVKQIFNLLTINTVETGILTNTGAIQYNVVIEQGLRWGDGVPLKPGESMNIAPLDNNLFSWAVWAPIIVISPSAAADAAARVHINARNITPATCTGQCETRWSGCHQGCSLDPHANAWCHAGCDSAQYICLAHCQ